jgi:perosamine synthetase
MLVTNRQDIRDRVLVLRDHGRRPGDRPFWNAEVAFKYKMSSLQAALGLAQLERLSELVARKREIFAWYENALRSTPGLTLNYEGPLTKNSYWMVTAVVSPAYGTTKEELAAKLATQQIDTRPFFYPLSSLPAYASVASAANARNRNTVAYAISPYGINLPSALSLTKESTELVCHALREALGRHL